MSIFENMNTLSRKQEICITAARLFKEKGYSAVTMRDLAAAMGIKAASLYNHISSKQEILSEIIITIAESFTEGIHEIVTSSKEPSQKLLEVIAQHVNLTADNPYGMASLNNDWMHLEKQQAYYLELRNTYELDFRSIIHEGKKKEVFKEVNEEVILFSVLSTLRNLYLWIPKKGDLNRDELVAELNKALQQGVARQ